MSSLLTDSRIETLLKVNDITALRHFVMHNDDLNFLLGIIQNRITQWLPYNRYSNVGGLHPYVGEKRK